VNGGLKKMKNNYLLLDILVLFSLTIYSQGNYGDEQSGSYADSLFKVGERYFLENNLYEAKEIFTKLLYQTPENLQTLEYLSQIAIAQQDLSSVKFYNEKILILDTDNIDALISLGVIYFNEHLLSEAEAQFDKVLNIEPDNESVLYNLGVLYGTKGEFHKAEITLNHAAQINPLNSKIYQTLGLFYLQNQSYVDAESNLLKAISIDKNLLEARKGLIILYQNQNKLDQSSKYIKEIETVSANYPQLNLLIANQKFLEGETDSAITYALKEIQEKPDQADAYYFLSTLYGLNGEEIKSNNAFAKAEKLFIKKKVELSDEPIMMRKSLIDSITK